ncbi:MAG: VWA domain-containing protein [Candidatus Firestonebacteria bacterium]
MLFSCTSKKSEPVLLGPGGSASSISTVCTQVENYYFPESKAFVSILDQGSVAVTDFALGNFSVAENGKPTIVTGVKRVNNLEEPLSTALVIDRSGSMGTTVMEAAKDAAKTYVSAMASTDSAAVILYDDQIEVTQSWTSDKNVLISAIDTAVARGGTATYDAILRGVDELKKQRGRKVVLVLTDGDDNASSNSNADTIVKVNKGGVCAFCIGVGGGVDMTNLTAIANGTGGRSYEAQTSDLAALFQQVLYQLNNQVQINFRSRLGDNPRELTIYLNYGTLSTTFKKTYGF